ncbi:ABC transporter substrate-binding protein [Bacillus sp. 1P02SD]|uniref:ABC transporter substrate-binding protein n=1 Tax=Bacillus sp. 1P02SD TaxID=3132264 RepID=UPI0039A1C4CB
MKKNGLLTLLSIFTLSLLLIGCGNDESEKASSSQDGDKVTLKFHTWINENTGNWEKVIEEFEKAHPDIKIETEVLVENADSREYLKKLDLLASSGEQLDVFMFSSPTDYVKRVDSGLIEPLDSYLEASGLDVTKEYNTPYPAIDGSYYGLPAKLNTQLVLLNKDHLDEAGLEVPENWTWDDYREYAKALTKEENGKKRYGSYFHTWPDTYHILKLLSKPEENSVLKQDGSSNMDDPLVKASLEYRYLLENEDGSSVPLQETLSQKLNYRQQFFSGSVSMIPTGSFLITQWGEFKPDFEMVWAPWPKIDDTDANYYNPSGDIMSIAKKSKHKEEAFEFIRWMTTEGMVVQERFIPSWKNADIEQLIDKLVASTANPEAVDVESLLYTLENSVAAEPVVPKPYISEVYDAYNTEAELYLLGSQDLDTSISKAIEKIEQIVYSNK